MSDMDLVLKAAKVAAEAHSNQRRKGNAEPYINHPLRVAHQAERCGLSATAIAAALLHDVVEDTPVTFADLRREFPEPVVHMVDLLTKWWPDDAPTEVKSVEKPKYYGILLGEKGEAIEVKLLDRADNLNDMTRMLPRNRGWAERYLKKTRREFEAVLAVSQNDGAQEIYRQAIRRLEQALGRADSEESARPERVKGGKGVTTRRA
ncbi:MAG TPA: HD domain-containing protein [Stenomitos sp.]